MAIQDSGSNYQFYDKKIDPRIQRSSFNLDYLNTFTAYEGQLIPFFRQNTLPNSDYNLSSEWLFKAINTPRVPLMSRQRAFMHYYAIPYNAMWPKWGSFMSKGRTGNEVIPLPKIRFVFNPAIINLLGSLHGFVPFAPSNELEFTRMLTYLGVGPGSLVDMLGFPLPADKKEGIRKVIEAWMADTTAVTPRVEIDYPAFPFFAYLSIYRNYYVQANLNTNDRNLFPIDENDFALVYPDRPDGNIFYAEVYYHPDARADVATDSSYVSTSVAGNGAIIPAYNGSLPSKLGFGYLKYRNFVDDYFTSALPWPMRGEIPELDIGGVVENSVSIPIRAYKESSLTTDLGLLRVRGFESTLNNAFSTGIGSNGGVDFSWNVNPVKGTDGATYYASTSAVRSGGLYSTINGAAGPGADAVESDIYIGAKGASAISFVSGFTWEMIRNLSISTLIAEKMARTDGSYIEFCRTFFDSYPENQAKNTPIYIGGNLQPILYTDVVQVSADTSTSPLGTIGGKGIGAGEDFTGKYHSNDFGIMLGILSIMPDTYYTNQGFKKQDLYTVQEDFYLPERAELGMQAVLSSEIYADGSEEVFGYQNRYDEWRYNANEVHGEVSNPHNETFFPFTQSRVFESQPVLSNTFLSTQGNIRKNFLTSLLDPEFIVQVANKNKAVLPLPYKAVPIGLK